MHHICVYTASTAQAAEVDTAALADSVLLIQNGHFVPPQDMPLIFGGTASANMSRGRISTPSLLTLTTPFIRPVSAAASWGMPPRINDLFMTPLTLKKLEEITLLTFHGGAGAEQVWGILGLEVRRTPPPGGQVYTLRGISTTAAVANTWTQIAMTWQNNLPVGTYAVVGGTHQSANGIAFRLISPPDIWRPGGISITALGNETDEMFRNGYMGEWIRFQNYQFPNIEVVAGGADAAHEVYLDLVKVG